jgi:hypothetical protein
VAFRNVESTAEVQEKAKARGSADFLTLLAAQERKVLELKEELQKAESDLVGLKRQWATYEGNKKRDEVKHVKKLQPLALDDVAARGSEENVDGERRRRRELVERSKTTVDTAGNATPSLGRRGSKRVFEGGRHTKTLSLLSPTSSKPNHSTVTARNEGRVSEDSANGSLDDALVKPSLSRMPTLDGIMNGEPLQLGFGKTYRDLAAHRRSMPPVPTDALMKQGKQVYDGVKDGLWTFIEDIRQATIGDEGINGTVIQQRPQRSNTKRSQHKTRSDQDKSHKPRPSPDSRDRASKEASFWNEFGLDTPRKSTSTEYVSPERPNGHIQQKSSTDSTNTPSLLQDGNDEVDDSWEAWESPASTKIATVDPDVKKSSMDGLPWPEIQKLTPSKLTRTVSDLMREWDSSQNQEKEKEQRNDSKGLMNGSDHDILSSPHL